MSIDEGIDYTKKHAKDLTNVLLQIFPTLTFVEKDETVISDKQDVRKAILDRFQCRFRNIPVKKLLEKHFPTRCHEFYQVCFQIVNREIGKEIFQEYVILVLLNNILCDNLHLILFLFSFYSSMDDFNRETHCETCFKFHLDRKMGHVHHVYSVMYALESFELDMYPFSHRLCGMHEHQSHLFFHRRSLMRVKINAGCFIIFDSNLIHAGTPFTSNKRDRKYRLHFNLEPNGFVAELTESNYREFESCNEHCLMCANISSNGLLNVIFNEGMLYTTYFFYAITIHVLSSTVLQNFIII